jgi:hypothetical protein
MTRDYGTRRQRQQDANIGLAVVISFAFSFIGLFCLIASFLPSRGHP